MKIRTQNRRLLQAQVNEEAMQATLPPDPLFAPTNGSSTATTRRPFKPNSPFDSSMALTILVLLTALFFMGFFSLYIRRFAEEETAEVRRRRYPSPRLRAEKNNHRGLDPATVKALPLVSYGGPAKHGIIEGCTICLSEFDEGEIVKLIPRCRHVFHPTCIDKWLVSHVSCPLCRSTQFFKKVDDEVRLDVMVEKNGIGVSELGGRSAAGESDTCTEMVRSCGGVRRCCSCSSLEGRVVLQRSTSF